LSNIPENINEELAALEADLVKMKSEAPREWKKAIIRWGITIILYTVFWNNEWVQWSLWIAIPLIILNILSMIVLPYFIEKKLNKVRELYQDEDYYKNLKG
jgi:phosphatidylglycerophosphate synthase